MRRGLGDGYHRKHGWRRNTLEKLRGEEKKSGSITGPVYNISDICD